MEMTFTAAHGISAYGALNRLVAPPSPTSPPPAETARFEPLALLPPPIGAKGPPLALPPLIGLTTPDVGITPGTPPPGLAPPAPIPQPAPSAPAPAGTAGRATTLYSQTQALTGGFAPAQLPTGAAPTPEAAPGPAPASTPGPGQPAGVVGITSLGGAVASPGQGLSFARGSFVNVLA
jgi:hypothetical protein